MCRLRRLLGLVALAGASACLPPLPARGGAGRVTVTRHESAPYLPTPPGASSTSPGAGARAAAPMPATSTAVVVPAAIGPRVHVGQLVTIGDADPAWVLARARELRGGRWRAPAGDGAALRQVLLERRAVIPFDQVGPGDLLLFERPVEAGVAPTWAVVIGRDQRAVVEVLYVAAARVRRGFVDPTRPRVRRDRDGRVVNTYLRHDRRTPSGGHRFLAGELLALAARLPHNE
ncbi:MAG: hypothetical protein KBG28_11870 [Kofleriaceae bacterium]|jgi:hypothetical protein|nr:hypothetical protein [Kofleriaceae bacterium]